MGEDWSNGYIIWGWWWSPILPTYLFVFLYWVPSLVDLIVACRFDEFWLNSFCHYSEGFSYTADLVCLGFDFFYLYGGL